MIDPRRFSKEKLFEIYKAAKRNEWHPDLGPKPDGFSDLPDKIGGLFSPAGKTKRDYTDTVANMVAEIIGPEELHLMLDRDSNGKYSLQKLISRSVPVGSLFCISDELFRLFTDSGEDADS